MRRLFEYLAALAALPRLAKATKQNTEAIRVTQEEITVINDAVDDLKNTVATKFTEFESELAELKAQVGQGTATPEAVQALIDKIAGIKESVGKFDIDPTKPAPQEPEQPQPEQ